MRAWSVFRVSLREQLRSPWDLVLVLALTPAFIFMYWSFMGGGSTSYKLLVLDRDRGICPQGEAVSCAQQAIEQLKEVTYADGAPLLRIIQVESQQAAEKMLRDRTATALVIFEPGFTAALQAPTSLVGGETSPQVIFVGDLRNPYYAVAAVMANAAIEQYLRVILNQPTPVLIAEQPLGGSAVRTEFEVYVPGLLICAGTMMLFSVAIAVTRQIEAGALRRLRLTRATAFDLMGGISLLYILIALLSVALAYLTALGFGFRSQGPLWLAILINVIAAIAVIGVGLMTACFSNTTARAAVIVNFPLMLLLFFSGAVFPVPDVALFTLGGHTFKLFELLPHTHAVVALNKVLSLGAGLSEVGFELGALVILTVVYFLAGIVMFQRMQFRSN